MGDFLACMYVHHMRAWCLRKWWASMWVLGLKTWVLCKSRVSYHWANSTVPSPQKHFTGSLLTVLEAIIILVGSREPGAEAVAKSVISRSPSSRQRERHWALQMLLKLRAHPQWHTTSNKATPPNVSQIVHRLETQHSYRWAHGGRSHPPQKERKNGWEVGCRSTALFSRQGLPMASLAGLEFTM